MTHDASPDRPGFLRNGIPLGEFIQRGFGFVVVPQDAPTRHNEVEFLKGIQPLFCRSGQSFPKANEWGVISAIVWGGSRAMDYLETDRDIAARRVAILGHSKCGKAALWTAAQDQHFALVISVQSGCAGAALWRRKYGETLGKLVTRFPYWLCRNAWKFANHEDDRLSVGSGGVHLGSLKSKIVIAKSNRPADHARSLEHEASVTL